MRLSGQWRRWCRTLCRKCCCQLDCNVYIRPSCGKTASRIVFILKTSMSQMILKLLKFLYFWKLAKIKIGYLRRAFTIIIIWYHSIISIVKEYWYHCFIIIECHISIVAECSISLFYHYWISDNNCCWMFNITVLSLLNIR